MPCNRHYRLFLVPSFVIRATFSAPIATSFVDTVLLLPLVPHNRRARPPFFPPTVPLPAIQTAPEHVRANAVGGCILRIPAGGRRPHSPPAPRPQALKETPAPLFSARNSIALTALPPARGWRVGISPTATQNCDGGFCLCAFDAATSRLPRYDINYRCEPWAQIRRLDRHLFRRTRRRGCGLLSGPGQRHGKHCYLALTLPLICDMNTGDILAGAVSIYALDGVHVGVSPTVGTRGTRGLLFFLLPDGCWLSGVPYPTQLPRLTYSNAGTVNFISLVTPPWWTGRRPVLAFAKPRRATCTKTPVASMRAIWLTLDARAGSAA